MKLFTAEQIKQADQYTINNEPISSIGLMERAAQKAALWIAEQYKQEQNIAVIVGSGNQGGDGLVIARILHQKGYPIQVFEAQKFKNYSPDFLVNQQRLSDECQIEIQPFKLFKDQYDILIDAILGTGLNRLVEGELAAVIHKINQSQSTRISIDIPSGLFSDDNQQNIANRYQSVVKADYTLSFHCPKLAFLFPNNANYVGQFIIFDIGIHSSFISEEKTPFHLMEHKDISPLWKKRNNFTHKGQVGHGLLIAGSEEKMGACILSAKAALRSGLGLLSCVVAKQQMPSMHIAIPECMCLKKEKFDFKNIELNQYKSLAIGPGIGTAPTTSQNLANLLRQCQKAEKPLIIDADAINIIAEQKHLIKHLPKESILTPHLKELERLIGPLKSDYALIDQAAQWANKHQVNLLIKGAYSLIISYNKKFYFNSTGNPGMATAGSGDVLTGILLGLLSQGYTPLHSLIMGVYIHGLSGDKAAEKLGENSLIASDIIQFLPKAMQSFGV